MQCALKSAVDGCSTAVVDAVDKQYARSLHRMTLRGLSHAHTYLGSSHIGDAGNGEAHPVAVLCELNAHRLHV